jgi:methionyl-tRNA formyltransferase
MVRAVTHPYPGAFVGDGPERVFIWSAEVANDGGASATPGTILSVRSGHGVTVAAGAGGLLVKRLQPAGEAEQAADDWAIRTGRRAGDSMMASR